MRRRVLTLPALLLVLAACTRAPRPAVPLAVPTADGRYLVGVFEGVLPCADCEGIRTRLTLYANGPDDFTRATYALVETYLGTSDGLQRFRAEGEWTLLRGDATDPDATVYQLDPGRPSTQRSFRVLDAQRIELLDREQRPIRSTLDYTLTRVAAPSPSP
ncbi:MAG: copper resistance protein NlpE [Candidatus Binatia bacterium]